MAAIAIVLTKLFEGLIKIIAVKYAKSTFLHPHSHPTGCYGVTNALGTFLLTPGGLHKTFLYVIYGKIAVNYGII